MASSSGSLDETGARYGRLTVLSRGSKDAARAYKWLCRCDCGVEKEVNGAHMRAGRILSCGCLGADRRRAAATSHGQSQTPAYRSWKAMIGRCYVPGNASYPAYGGKGVTVCSAWRESYEAFLADMGPRPDGTSLDRIDNGKPYTPENCRWATSIEQQGNRRMTVTITALGRTQSLADWSRETGIPQPALRARIKNGWEPDEAVSRKLMKAIHGIDVRLT